MVEFAYVECGLSVDEFYDLSFYEWALEVRRVKRKAELLSIKWEGQASLFRELMALLANINRNPKKSPSPFEGKDFIPLSFDKPKEKYVSKQMTQDEVDARIKKLESKIKKNGR
jgi:hypothetical protein